MPYAHVKFVYDRTMIVDFLHFFQPHSNVGGSSGSPAVLAAFLKWKGHVYYLCGGIRVIF